MPAPFAVKSLDLDHISAQVAEHLRRKWPLHQRCEVKNPDVR
jgi:hypothetical protein